MLYGGGGAELFYLLVECNKIQVRILHRQQKKQRISCISNPCCSSTSVYKCFSIGRRIILYNPGHIRNVNSSCHDVCTYQNTLFNRKHVNRSSILQEQNRKKFNTQIRCYCREVLPDLRFRNELNIFSRFDFCLWIDNMFCDSFLSNLWSSSEKYSTLPQVEKTLSL